MVQERAGLSALVVDGIQGMADLLAFGQGSSQIEKIHSQSQKVGQAQMKLAWAGGTANALSSLAMNLTLLAVLAAAIPLVSAGQLEGVMLAVISLLVLSSFEAVAPLPQAGQQLESSLTAARRLFAIAVDKPQNGPAV